MLENYVEGFDEKAFVRAHMESEGITLSEAMSRLRKKIKLESYYQTLSKGEKGKALVYIAMYLDISYPSLQGKFTGKQKFTTAELIALEPIINDELWRQ